jgi:hypothetical protein
MTPEQREKYEREEAEYRAWTAYYGSQYYGGWNRDPKDGRYKPQAVIDEEATREKCGLPSKSVKGIA